ncbi:DMT family transporter [Halorarum halophilum]|uniref:DMT family transporter n=1 Tax=Halorarum halophilum TaxID=2743090 RepID=A0A7D5KWL0_9EURY|nr:DMT family transporter [Halobaculum halophilum]QLG26838.1 DMT family transporter [Halobaculum halophilum]
MRGARDAAGFLTLAAVWGTAFVATKAALADFPPVLLAALRFDIAAVLLFGLAFAGGRRIRPAGAGDLRPIATGGLFSIGAHHALLFSGQVYVTSAVAATLIGLIPVLTPMTTRLLRSDESLDAVGVLGVLVGFGGLLVIARPDPRNLAANAGALFVFGSAVAWVLGAVTTREDDATLRPLAMQAWMALVGAASLHVAALALGQGVGDATATAGSLGWLVYLAVVPGAGGFLLYFRLLDRLGPIQAGLLEYAIPPFAAAFGWLVLKETLAPGTVRGFLLVLVAFLLVKRRALRAGLRRAFG